MTDVITIDPTALRTDDAAAFLGVKATTMRSWRSRNLGPKWVGVAGRGGYVSYRIADLEEYKRNPPLDRRKKVAASHEGDE